MQKLLSVIVIITLVMAFTACSSGKVSTDLSVEKASAMKIETDINNSIVDDPSQYWFTVKGSRIDAGDPLSKLLTICPEVSLNTDSERLESGHFGDFPILIDGLESNYTIRLYNNTPDSVAMADAIITGYLHVYILDNTNPLDWYFQGPEGIGFGTPFETVLKILGNPIDYYEFGPTKAGEFEYMLYWDNPNIENQYRQLAFHIDNDIKVSRTAISNLYTFREEYIAKGYNPK